MSSASQSSSVSSEIRSLLAGLRRRIRAYVWLEGIALAAVWVGLTFWITLGLDYLPILVGASEMPRAARFVLLLVTAGGLGYILYRWIWQRAFVPMPDRSMAVLVERRFNGFQDSLLTAVELAQRPAQTDGFSGAMLQHTLRDAVGQVSDVRLRRIFSLSPLLLKLALAVVSVGSLIGFSNLYHSAFEQAAHRIWGLSNEPWQRSAQIEIVGVDVQRTGGSTAQPLTSTLLPFENGRVKVARGANVTLRVRAAADARVVPDTCTIYFRGDDGERGRVPMSKIGRIKKDEFGGASADVQNYAFDGKPFKAMLSSLSFDVVGFDHRLRDYRIEVVESPTVIETQLACEFPAYMVDDATSSWQPRTVPYLATGTQLPRGTKLKVAIKANKELRSAQIHNPESNETTSLEISGSGDAARGFEFPVASLNGNLTLDIMLQDTDHVLSDKPQRLFIAAIPDEAPRVDVRLKGISTVVTPDVVLPVRGKITDDYGVAKTWFDLLVNDGQPRQMEFLLPALGEVSQEIDFRDLRADVDSGVKLEPKDKIHIKIQAADKCDLSAGANIGSGDQYQLEVVTPEELLRMLEVRELSLRRRFEQTISELADTRDSLLHVKTESDDEPAPKDPLEKKTDEGDATIPAPAADDSKGTELERVRSLRLLRVQRAAQQSLKAGQEVLGVAVSFADIREELINNRVDTEDRKERLKEQIADPLRSIAEKDFPELDRRLAALEKALNDPTLRLPAVDSAIQQTNDVLLQLNDVLQRMLDLETYNELLDIVRGLIKDQQELLDQTKKQKKKQLLDLTK